MSRSSNISIPREYPLHAAELLFKRREESSFYFLRKWQFITLISLLAGGVTFGIYDIVLFLSIFHGICVFAYISMFAYQTFVILKGLVVYPEIKISEDEVRWLRDEDLPVYTILVPLYREAEVVPQLVQAINSLDYPKSKLDVKLLVEEDDRETLQALVGLPPHFKVTVVPPTGARTKPKACNYGLVRAEGEYLVIYDAEDIPEPDQLKKVIVAFQKVGDEVDCIQAKLDYYNPEQNILTRLFTAEYSYWFNVLLPGLWVIKAPIPLGGTSNHFKVSSLKRFDGWDPYNVTEDCDLGIALAKRGSQTAIIDSTTWEEANSALKNWIRQRSRWSKGYMQTWMVYMDHPLQLLKAWGLKKFFDFQIMVGGTWVTRLLNPYFWIMTIIYWLTRSQLIEGTFPGIVFYAGTFCLIFANFFYVYFNLLGCMKREYYKLTPYTLLVPFYWFFMSIAGWYALIQSITRPHYWEKTIHGLHLIGANFNFNYNNTVSAVLLANGGRNGPSPWDQRQKLSGKK